MRILIASDKYKGSLTAAEACAAIRAGLGRSSGDGSLELESIPIADGGDGMAEAITAAKQGDWIEVETEDALGRPVRAGYGWVASESLAVIEMAAASGLWQLEETDRDPWRASTFGTGLLIRHAIRQKGAARILLGIGGSATNDGGSGMARALGWRFLGSGGDEINDLPADLEAAVEIGGDAALAVPPVLVACDVTNPLLGENGCTRVYGPQKGIRESDFEKHEHRLRHLIDLTGSEGARAADVPGSGAAGGLGFGCLAFLGAELRPGFDLVAEILDLERAVERCDLVITGEGRLDSQTLQGKGPAGIAALAKKHGKPAVAFTGMIEPGSESELASVFDGIHAISPPDLPVSESMARGAELLTRSVQQHGERLRSLAKSLQG